MAKSTIEWTEFTFNPWIGCTKVSPGCKNCYAEKMTLHRKWPAEWGIDGARKITAPSTWKNPLSWNRLAIKEVRRIRVFCSSLADVFEDRQDLIQPRAQLFELIKATPDLDWLLLTKRPENIVKMLPPDWGTGWENVWLGTSTEDQIRYDQRIDHLLAVPAQVHFLSAEPLIAPLKLKHGRKEGLDWVIVGGESGPGFREMDLDWARSIRDDCSSLGVSYFFKQHAALRPKSKGHLLDGTVHHAAP